MLKSFLQLLKKGDECADHNNVFTGLDFGSIVRVDTRAKIYPRCRPALPTHIGQGIHCGNPDRATNTTRRRGFL